MAVLKFTNVTIDVKNKNKGYGEKYLRLVDNMTGTFETGEIVAFMGPSGGGKTTFMNAIAGRIQPGSKTTGSITYDGAERKFKEWTQTVAYVDQSDPIIDNLTLEDSLYYSAWFCLIFLKNEIVEKLKQMLDLFFLSPVARNLLSKLSGGERKRGEVAIELITDKDIHLYDEILGALDAYKAYSILKSLKKMAKEQGKLIIISVHQPSNDLFTLFDRVMLIAKGKCVYLGPTSACEEKFKEFGLNNESGRAFCDYMLEIVSDQNMALALQNPNMAVNKMIEHYCPMPEAGIIYNSVMKNDFYIDTSFNLKSIYILVHRKWKMALKDKWSNTKSAIWRIVFILIYIGLFNYLSHVKDSDIKRLCSRVLRNDSDAFAVKMGIIHKKTMAYTNLGAIIYFLGFINAYKGVQAFRNDIPFMRREIAVNRYSTVSLYIATLMFGLLYEFQYSLISIMLSCFLNSYTLDWRIILGYVGMPFFSQLFGMFVGALSSNSMLISVLSTLCGLFCSSSITILSAAEGFYWTLNNTDPWALNYLRFLFLISPAHHFNALLTLTVWQRHKSFVLTTFGTFTGNKILDDYSFGERWPARANFLHANFKINACQTYINGDKMSISTISLLLVGSTIICIGVGIFLLGKLLMPSMRMRLSRK